ncbi:MAG: hypothetical protein UCN29_01885, partial [[Ruminococcus] torques]|uniref:hypothetical protein n=1 Tax=[Ruminococcus] torques TaxID=33039 RepID=UPI002E777B7C
CSCDNVILPSFIALIEYQKETKPQVNLKETLSQVNNKPQSISLSFFQFMRYNNISKTNKNIFI